MAPTHFAVSLCTVITAEAHHCHCIVRPLYAQCTAQYGTVREVASLLSPVVSRCRLSPHVARKMLTLYVSVRRLVLGCAAQCTAKYGKVRQSARICAARCRTLPYFAAQNFRTMSHVARKLLSLYIKVQQLVRGCAARCRIVSVRCRASPHVASCRLP